MSGGVIFLSLVDPTSTPKAAMGEFKSRLNHLTATEFNCQTIRSEPLRFDWDLTLFEICVNGSHIIKLEICDLALRINLEFVRHSSYASH